MTPHALYSVCVRVCTLVNEVSVVVNGAVRNLPRRDRGTLPSNH